jgi:hypothetical protein
VESINVKVDETNVLKTRKESRNSKEQEARRRTKKKKKKKKKKKNQKRSNQKQSKKKQKTINKISRHLLRHLNAGIRRIIH